MLRAITIAVAGLVSLVVTTAVGYAAYIEVTTKEPAYRVLRSHGAIQLRAYEPMTVAEVVTAGARQDAVGEGFRPLAGYIFGGNAHSDSISMTAPVIQQPTSTPEPDRNLWSIRFVMPEEWSLETLPRPDDPAIALHDVPRRTVAVVRFPGFADDTVAAEKTAALEAWIASAGLVAQSEPMIAYYNAPWIPGLLRRNEIMIEVADPRPRA